MTEKDHKFCLPEFCFSCTFWYLGLCFDYCHLYHCDISNLPPYTQFSWASTLHHPIKSQEMTESSTFPLLRTPCELSPLYLNLPWNLDLDLLESANCIDKVAVFAPSPHLALLIQPTVLSASPTLINLISLSKKKNCALPWTTGSREKCSSKR